MQKILRSTYAGLALVVLSTSFLTACDNGYSMGGRAGTGALIGGGTGAAIGALAGGALGAGVGAATTPNKPKQGNYNQGY